MNKKIIMIVTIIITIPIILAVSALAVLYFWPRHVESLQSADVTKYSYDQAIEKAKAIQAADKKVANRAKNCETKVYTHKKQTAKAIIMLHGITACTDQYDILAKRFFDAGYNIYVPLAPHHGTKDPKEHSNITIDELAHYMNTSLSIASGLGKEVGVIGLSGGGNLATWMALYGDISTLLVLSPFYEPAVSAAPKWKLPLLKTLYGRNLLTDSYVKDFSLRTLAKYLLVKDNYKSDYNAPHLQHVAVVTSANDPDIDLTLAHAIPQSIAKANDTTFLQTRLSKKMSVGHEILQPKNEDVKKYLDQLYDLYFDFYENRQPEK